MQLFPECEFSAAFWLVTHKELRRSARIRALYDFLAELLEKNRNIFLGRDLPARVVTSADRLEALAGPDFDELRTTGG